MKQKVVVNYMCPHCGRRWHGEGRWTGFLWPVIRNHIALCEKRTPAERRKINIRDERRWKNPRYPLAAQIWNDPTHPGLKD